MNDTYITDDARGLYNFMITLLLSWQLARVYGRSEAAAIKKTARRILKEVDCPKVYETFKKIARSESDYKVVEVCERCYRECKELEIL